MPDDLTTRPVTGADTLRRGVRVLWRGIRDEPAMFALAVVGSAVYGAGTAGAGWLLGHLTQTVLAPAFSAGRITNGQLAYVVGSLALVAVLTSVGVVVRRAAAGAVMFRLQARYRRAVTRQYLRLPLAWHHRHPAGQLLSNANADVEAIWQVFAPLPMAIGVVVMLVVAAAAMLAADPLLGAVGLLVLPAVFGANVVFQRIMSPRVVRAQQLRAGVSEVAHESFEGAVVVKTLGREAAETSRFGVVAGELRDANVAVGVTRGFFDPLLEALPVLGTLAVLVIGTARIAAGAATTADVVQVAYLLALVSFPVRALGWVLGELPRTVVGWERVSAVLAARGEMTYGERRLDVEGAAALDVEGVDYAYDGAAGERFPVLHRVTVDVAPGSTVAVVGPTGSGKSTLAGLLVRLVDPADGRVLVDGVDLRQLRRGELAGHAALVPQGTFVFDDTIRGNVALGADVDDAAVHRALALARAEDFVAALPDGLDTRVGERGTTLSGGQRQRLALARALVRRPRLLVLDDATSAVDPHVEARILAGLRGMNGPRNRNGAGAPGTDSTVIVIAYRMATIALADEVVYLEQGRVAGRGSHAELMRTSEGYRRLVTAYERDAVERAERAERAARSGGISDEGVDEGLDQSVDDGADEGVTEGVA